MAFVGPDAILTVQGITDHDVGSLNWKSTKEKTLFIPVGKDESDRATSAPAVVEWDMELQRKPDGSTGIDWEGWRDNNEVHPVVVRMGTEYVGRMVGCMVNEVADTFSREDGKPTVSVSGIAIRFVKE